MLSGVKLLEFRRGLVKKINFRKALSGKMFKCTVDLGCGKGGFYASVVKNHTKRFLGVDISKESLLLAEKAGYYDELIHSDLVNFATNMKDLDTDSVFMIHSIEHIDNKQVRKLLDATSDIPFMVVITPSKMYGKKFEAQLLKNPYQEHRSLVTPDLLHGYGFKVYAMNNMHWSTVYGFELLGVRDNHH